MNHSLPSHRMPIKIAQWGFRGLLAGMIVLAHGTLDLPAAEQLTPEELLSGAIEKFQNLRSYQCRMVLHLTRGEQVQDSEYLFYYQKPHLIRMYVKEGRNKGSSVLLREDGSIRGRRGGLFKVFPVTLSPDDERLRDLWDRRFYNSDWGTLLREMEGRLDKCSCRVEPVDGDGQLLLTLEGDDGYLEQAWFDKEQLILRRKHVRLENGDRLDVTWTDTVLNPEFKEGFFNL